MARADGIDVVDEMVHLQRDLGIGFINFYDDNFTLNRNRVMAICQEIMRRGLNIEWKCEVESTNCGCGTPWHHARSRLSRRRLRCRECQSRHARLAP